uniref:Uncharacterized protein n=1 Tax=Arion vulgaris TaxID=1028688 RepID=A0A0B6YAB5_9EUPU
MLLPSRTEFTFLHFNTEMIKNSNHGWVETHKSTRMRDQYTNSTTTSYSTGYSLKER